MDVVLALGFDLFFKPRINQAAADAGVEVRYAQPDRAVEAAGNVARVVADVSAPGVQDAVLAILAARPGLPVLACYPHVEEQRAVAVRNAGGTAIPRGQFSGRLAEALAGTLQGGA